MTNILVRPLQLRQISEQLKSSANKIGTALQAIDNAILALKGDKFLGNRANAVQAIYRSRRQALQKAEELVMHFSVDLEQTADVFENADSSGNTSMLMPISAVPPLVDGIDWEAAVKVSKLDKGITPELIAAILEYEINHRDILDNVADLEAKFILLYEGKLEDLEVSLLNASLKGLGESFMSISFGPTQMNPDTVVDLVEKGYISKPENWDTDQRDVILSLLLDEKKAPELVAARLEQIYDHWKDGGVDISSRPDVLGNLYGLGLDGTSGVHADLPDDQGPRGEEIEQRVLDLKLQQGVI